MLTSSPSPTLSPKTSFHGIALHHSARRASQSQTLPSSPRIRRPTSASRLLHSSPTAASTQSPSSAPSKPEFVDVGTQYTPKGLPPTAEKVTAIEDTPRSTGTKAKRRDPSPEPLIAPEEPNLRVDPQPSRPNVPAPGETNSSSTQSAEEPSSSKRPRPDIPRMKCMPLRYEQCDPFDLGTVIANMLMELIRINDKIPLKDGQLTRFHSRAPPAISVKDYLVRLITHATLSPPILLSMVYYIDRLCALYEVFTITSLTVHRFLITSATVASKGLSDSFWTNSTYAKVGGLTMTELALLELDFLQRMEWRIVPKPEVLNDYYRSLVERSEGYTLEKDEHASPTANAGGD